MHSILWTSILASAGVAVLTTLLVEYLAKPGLEARKERILEDRRQKRHALGDIRRVAGLGEFLHACCSEGDWRGKTKRAATLREEIYKLAVEMDDLMKSAYGVMGVPEWMDEEWSDAAATVSGFSIRIRAGENAPAEAWDDFEKAVTWLWAFVGFSQMSRVWRRRKAFELIKSYLLSRNRDKTSEEDDNR
jgi:hypothetical protein